MISIPAEPTAHQRVNRNLAQTGRNSHATTAERASSTSLACLRSLNSLFASYLSILVFQDYRAQAP